MRVLVVKLLLFEDSSDLRGLFAVKFKCVFD